MKPQYYNMRDWIGSGNYEHDRKRAARDEA